MGTLSKTMFVLFSILFYVIAINALTLSSSGSFTVDNAVSWMNADEEKNELATCGDDKLLHTVALSKTSDSSSLSFTTEKITTSMISAAGFNLTGIEIKLNGRQSLRSQFSLYVTITPDLSDSPAFTLGRAAANDADMFVGSPTFLFNENVDELKKKFVDGVFVKVELTPKHDTFEAISIDCIEIIAHENSASTTTTASLTSTSTMMNSSTTASTTLMMTSSSSQTTTTLPVGNQCEGDIAIFNLLLANFTDLSNHVEEDKHFSMINCGVKIEIKADESIKQNENGGIGFGEDSLISKDKSLTIETNQWIVPYQIETKGSTININLNGLDRIINIGSTSWVYIEDLSENNAAEVDPVKSFSIEAVEDSKFSLNSFSVLHNQEEPNNSTLMPTTFAAMNTPSPTYSNFVEEFYHLQPIFFWVVVALIGCCLIVAVITVVVCCFMKRTERTTEDYSMRDFSNVFDDDDYEF